MRLNLYVLGWISGVLLFLLGVLIIRAAHQTQNLRENALAFLFVGPAIFLFALTAWFNNRYHRYPFLLIGIVLSGLLFVTGFIFAMVTFFS